MENSILIKFSHVSQSDLAEMLFPLTIEFESLKVTVPKNKEGFNMDPATIAIVVSAGTLVVVQLLKSLTDIYIQSRKEKFSEESKHPPVNLNIELIVGNSIDLNILDIEEIEPELKGKKLNIDNIYKVNLK